MAKARMLIRVDDRLVHGQVCVGWCEALDISEIILCDNEIARSDFEQDLFLCCPSDEQTLHFMTVSAFVEELSTPPSSDTIAVVSSPQCLLDLLDQGGRLESAHIGGMHSRPGARRLLDYIFVTPEQERVLRLLLDRGVRITCQDLPGNQAYDLRTLLDA